jgi:hypothetical protein
MHVDPILHSQQLESLLESNGQPQCTWPFRTPKLQAHSTVMDRYHRSRVLEEGIPPLAEDYSVGDVAFLKRGEGDVF